MPSASKKIDMFNSEEGTAIRERLLRMEQDTGYHTEISTYTANGSSYPDNQIPFVDKHLAYLNSHPGVDPEHYMSNLRLKLRVRS